ncbi:MAG: ABC transporter substrate-binding protein [Syntrophomonadaceae bacterium]|jgi:hypothetical protein|nr:ABC transporter substrate-binding protein [Syntrophomonadaceae bacterium]
MTLKRSLSRVVGTGILLVIGLVFLFFPTEGKEEKLVIGIPDDAAGYIMRSLVEEGEVKAEISTMLGVYPIKDCCTSTSEWALSTERLDIAVLCPDAAARLIEKDQRYSVWGPCMVNSDILLGPGTRFGKIGITQHRWYIGDVINRVFGGKVEGVSMLANALPYALAEGKVDAVVIDVSKALRLDWPRQVLQEGSDTVSYVLVLRKDLEEDDRFTSFLQEYNQQVHKLEDQDYLQRFIEKYAGYTCGGKEAQEWNRMNVRYLPLTTPATR